MFCGGAPVVELFKHFISLYLVFAAVQGCSYCRPTSVLFCLFFFFSPSSFSSSTAGNHCSIKFKAIMWCGHRWSGTVWIWLWRLYIYETTLTATRNNQATNKYWQEKLSTELKTYYSSFSAWQFMFPGSSYILKTCRHYHYFFVWISVFGKVPKVFFEFTWPKW